MPLEIRRSSHTWRVRAAERIRLINNCAERLRDYGWADIDFILGQVGARTSERWDWDGDVRDAKFAYVREMLGSSSYDDPITDLDEYLSAEPPEPEVADTPWEGDGTFRVFLSHLAQHKAEATAIKSALAFYGLDAFVAHQDIEPGSEWQQTILGALRTCHALVALLHDGFRDSNWCDQEVGYAMGRGIPAIPVRLTINPYGFLGSFQAVKGTNVEPDAIAREIATILIRDKRTADAVTNAVVHRLVHAYSFNQANELSGLLATHTGSVTWEHVDALTAARRRNGELQGAFHFLNHLSTIKAALPQPAKAKPEATYDEPF